MNKFKGTLVFIISVILLQTSCTKNAEVGIDSEFNELVGTWKMVRGYEYLVENGVKVPGSRSSYEREDLYYFVFHATGDVTTHDVRGIQLDKATYTFDKVGRIINFVERSVKLQFRVVELSSTTLNFTVFIKDGPDESLHDLYFKRSADLQRGR
ncbi:hypothetical protein [Sphingobacterium paludis]|uniref:Lipocalin-like protein n=1 Tax=Sphingobacterium paludis TaxID=1476465 RepID=A0A4R7D5F5_9SPHI|nr:hypothetical protein [Sphingobacterium paludis]TDS14955.1 hypothetical protein B0I21_103457 [Sphingobacterium paludis]